MGAVMISGLAELSEAREFAPVIELSALNSTTGFQISGEAASDYSGVSVSSAGDVNGDGFAVAIFGALRAGSNGSFSGNSCVVFGNLLLRAALPR